MERAACGKAATRHRVARHRHARSAAPGIELYSGHRRAPGTDGRLSRGDCLSHGLYRGRRCAAAGDPDEVEHVRAVSAARAGTGSLIVRAVPTDIPGVLVVEPDVYRDARGFFLETYHAEKYKALG